MRGGLCLCGGLGGWSGLSRSVRRPGLLAWIVARNAVNRPNKSSIRCSPLRSVPNGIDGDALGLYSIEHYVRSATDDQLTDIRLRAHPAQIRMLAEDFDDCDDAGGQPGGSLRLVP